MTHGEEQWAEGEREDPLPSNLTEPVQRIRDALPTSRHAQMLFDMVVARLGDVGVVESAGGKTQFSLYRREDPGSDAIIPWPLLRLGIRGRLSTVVMISAPPGTPDEPPPRPGEAPKLRGLGPGEIVIHDGPHAITVTYGEDGRWMETSRSERRDAHAGVLPVLAKKSAQPTELIAEYVAGIDLARHGPGRVLRPCPLPGGLRSAWYRGLHAIRDALFDDRIPPDVRWAVADGFTGTALAWGASREEAIAAWQGEIEREQPKPVIAEAPAKPQPDFVERTEQAPGQFLINARLSGPSADVPWPEMIPANTPAAVIPLESCPHEAGDWGAWIRLVGTHGGTVFAVLKRDVDGCTLVGEGLAECLDLGTLEETLDAADMASVSPITARPDWPAHLPPLNSHAVTYRLVDEDTRLPSAPAIVESTRNHGFITKALDGDRLRWRAVRQRWVED